MDDVGNGVGRSLEQIRLNRRGASQRADNADGQGAFQAEWIAEGDGQLPHIDARRVGHLHRLQAIGRQIHLEHSQVTVGIGAQHPGRQRSAVIENNRDPVGAIDHVVVGDDASLVVPDKAGPQAALRLRHRGHAGIEGQTRNLGDGRRCTRHSVHDLDIDHRGIDLGVDALQGPF